MSEAKNLLILGFGGHARSVADVALTLGFQQLMFIDENAVNNEQFLGFPVQRNCDPVLPADWLCMPASGDNRCRDLQTHAALIAGWALAILIAPSATVGVGAKVSPGCFVGHHAHIGAMAQIGMGCVINTGAVVEHECVVGDYVHISVNATVAGRAHIGNFVWIGAGATVIDKVGIAAESTIGAGGVVISSLTRSGTYVGVPVRRINA